MATTYQQRKLFFFIFTALALLSLSNSCFANSDTDAITEQDRAFLQAKELSHRSPDLVQSFLVRNKDYPLNPWLEYALIEKALKTANLSLKKELRNTTQLFITRYQGTYLANKLANDWLSWLHQKEQFEEFISFYSNHQIDEDIQLKCLFANAKLITGPQKTFDSSLLSSLLKNSNALATEACTQWVSNLGENTLLTPVQTTTILLLLAEQKDLRASLRILPYLPTEMRVTAKELQSAYQATTSQIVKMSHEKANQHLLLAIALTVLSNKDYSATLQIMPQLEKPLGTQISQWVYGQIGAKATKEMDLNASNYFSKVNPSLLSGDVLAYAWRAALFGKNQQPNFGQIVTFIEALPDTEQQDPAVRYWYARALIETGSKDKGVSLMRQLAKDEDFYYGWLAKESFGESVSCHNSLFPTTTSSFIGTPANQLSASTQETLNRIKLLTKLSLHAEAAREWASLTKSLPIEQVIRIGHWALDNRLYIRSIAAGEKAKKHVEAMNLRYPLLYRTYTQPNAKNREIPESWILGLMRQESRFMETISSYVGAQGLMQIMPATGKMLAKQESLSNFTTSELRDPKTNIQLGSLYMKQTLQQLSNSYVLATAAYNAGPSRPKKWRGLLVRSVPAEFFIEHIPFSETRGYVKSVLSNAACYQSILENKPVKLSTWLGTISPN
jgi:soluble lytic murein transglycosylase